MSTSCKCTIGGFIWKMFYKTVDQMLNDKGALKHSPWCSGNSVDLTQIFSKMAVKLLWCKQKCSTTQISIINDNHGPGAYSRRYRVKVEETAGCNTSPLQAHINTFIHGFRDSCKCMSLAWRRKWPQKKGKQANPHMQSGEEFNPPTLGSETTVLPDESPPRLTTLSTNV